MADNVVKLKPKAAITADQLTVKIATSDRHLGRVANKNTNWLDLCTRLTNTAWDTVTMKQFKAKPIAWQHERKNQGYFVGGQFKTGARKIQNLVERTMLTFDIDNCTPSLMGDIELGATWLGDFEYFYYTTRSHTKEKPRVRVVVPLAEPIEVAKLNPLSRIIAQKLDKKMEAVDPVSFRPAQVMYWPNTCYKSEFLAGRNKGPLLDGNAELVKFGDWKDYSLLPRSGREKDLREAGDKATDPTTKRGPVGAFSRAYPISAAIETFLSDVYELGDGGTDGQPRYSFLAGSTRNGAVVYDDDKFLYSNHGTDPVADTLVNSFDLVRIHKFGDKDKATEKEFKPDNITETASYKAMVDFIQGDRAYTREMRDDQYDLDAVLEDFVADDEENEEEQVEAEAHGEPPPNLPPKVETRPEVTSAPADWMDQLEITDKGIIKSNLHNIRAILVNDPRFRGRLAHNQILDEVVITRRIRSKQYGYDTRAVRNKENGDLLSPSVAATIRAILESPRGEGKSGYSLKVSDRDLRDGIDLAADEFSFNPIANYIHNCKWDGVPRIKKLLHTYCHAEDNAYHEQVSHNLMVAAVLRVFEPGSKFDFVTILEGPQGIRKSTFILELVGGSRFGELRNDFDETAKLVEQLKGKWVVEIPELVQFGKSDTETLKAIFSAQKDTVRLAFGRGVKDYFRQCIFMGTTNRKVYLKDDENRRYWPVRLTDKIIDTEGVRRDRELLWAEAYAVYLYHRRQVGPDNSLPLYLTGEVAATQREITQARTTISVEEILKGQIVEWLSTPVSVEQAKVGYRPDTMGEDGEEVTSFLRVQTCVKDICFYLMEKDDRENDARLSQQISNIMAELPDWSRHGAMVRAGKLGKQRVFDRMNPETKMRYLAPLPIDPSDDL